MSFAECFAMRCLNVRCEVIDGTGRRSHGSGIDRFLPIWPVTCGVVTGELSADCIPWCSPPPLLWPYRLLQAIPCRLVGRTMTYCVGKKCNQLTD